MQIRSSGNVLGNPVTRLKDFDGYVSAFLPRLVYYEFKMVDASARKLNTDQNQGEIFKVSFKHLIYLTG